MWRKLCCRRVARVAGVQKSGSHPVSLEQRNAVELVADDDGLEFRAAAVGNIDQLLQSRRKYQTTGLGAAVSEGERAHHMTRRERLRFFQLGDQGRGSRHLQRSKWAGSPGYRGASYTAP